VNRARALALVGLLSTSAVAQSWRAARPDRQQHAVTDQRGRTFVFSEPAHRVVPIAIPLLWTFMTVDGSDARIVGANAVAISQLHDGIVGKIFPHVDKVSTAVTRGGTFTPNIEALLALKPDAVIQWADRGDALMDVLDRAGLRALGVKNTNNESDIDTWIRISGGMSGHEARADSLIRWMQAGNRRFDSLTKAIPIDSRPRVLVLTEYSRTITANGPHSYAGTIVERAGGRNVATVDGNVGIEQVLAWNPDVILLTAFENKHPSDLIADPRWAPTPAARQRQVYKLPFGVTRWGGYGPESPLFLTWLVDLLHPTRFNLPLRPALRDAYRQLFHYDVTDSDIDRVLQMSENSSSANYARFQRIPAR
jgi:iron complex transport system substrate-binding protein